MYANKHVELWYYNQRGLLHVSANLSWPSTWRCFFEGILHGTSCEIQMVKHVGGYAYDNKIYLHIFIFTFWLFLIRLVCPLQAFYILRSFRQQLEPQCLFNYIAVMSPVLTSLFRFLCRCQLHSCIYCMAFTADMLHPQEPTDARGDYDSVSECGYVSQRQAVYEVMTTPYMRPLRQ